MQWNSAYLNGRSAMWHIYNPYLYQKYQRNTRQSLSKTCGSLTWNILFSCPWQVLGEGSATLQEDSCPASLVHREVAHAEEQRGTDVTFSQGLASHGHGHDRSQVS